MKIITLHQKDDQYFSMILEKKAYRFRLLDRGIAGVFLDVYVSNKLLITGILCLDRVRIIRLAYKRFPGDLMFVDQLAFDNPQFSYFNERFKLYYLTSDELDMGN